MYLTNEYIDIDLPEIDNVTELDHEKRNRISVEKYRNKMSNIILHKDKRTITKYFLEIFNENGFDGNNILKNNQKWLNNIFTFKKDFNPVQNIIRGGNFYKDISLAREGFLKKDIEIKEIAQYAKKLLKDSGDYYSRGKKYSWDNICLADKFILNKLNFEFKEKGLLKEAGAFLGRKVSVKKAFVILSKPDDKVHKLFLGDIEDFDSKYINLHIDPKGGLIKAIVYLNNVDANSGPFQIVRKSLNYKIDPLKMLFARSISTSNYCDSPKNRLLINSLPKGLRSSLNIGRMLKENSRLVKLIDKNIVTITSDQSNTILFVPDKTIHRGAVCSTSNRLALQIQIY